MSAFPIAPNLIHVLSATEATARVEVFRDRLAKLTLADLAISFAIESEDFRTMLASDNPDATNLLVAECRALHYREAIESRFGFAGVVLANRVSQEYRAAEAAHRLRFADR